MTTNYQEKMTIMKSELTLDDLMAVEQAMLDAKICTCKSRFIYFDGEMHEIEATTDKAHCAVCGEKL